MTAQITIAAQQEPHGVFRLFKANKFIWGPCSTPAIAPTTCRDGRPTVSSPNSRLGQVERQNSFLMSHHALFIRDFKFQVPKCTQTSKTLQIQIQS